MLTTSSFCLYFIIKRKCYQYQFITRNKILLHSGIGNEWAWNINHRERIVYIMNNSFNNQTSELFQWKELQSFQHMDLDEKLIRGIYSYGFQKPADIQKKTILPIKAGLDVIAQSEAGSGKTAAYVIGMLSRISDRSKQIHGIIIVPVRELALAVCKFIKCLCQFKNIKVQSCVGGTLLKDQKYLINKQKPQILVGTPGRILDHIQKRTFKTDSIKTVILDQADQLLSKVFVDQIIQIFKNMPQDSQSCTFSATYGPQVLEITNKFMKQPYKVLLDSHQIPVGGIKQFHVALDNQTQKLPTLLNICKKLLIHHWIIFVKTNEKANEVGTQLTNLGVPVTVIHSQVQDRNAALQQFKSGKTRILICTDVMARGIDISSVSMVINYDMPHPRAAVTQYLHRIGRCGRFGKAGVSISLTLQQDSDILYKLRKYYRVDIKDLPTDPQQIAPWLAKQ